ncbi:hypothetical protein BCA37_18250 [Mycobacterium sp. djl-10]|nr:hypothetical protein BCA37_18250 [Mycobacterium sp. djl-10]
MDEPQPFRPLRVVIVGAGVAGVRTATALRRRGFAGDVVLLSEETRLPYDRPPLTKQILHGTWRAEQARLIGPEQLDELGIELRLGARAVGLGPHSVRLADGEAVSGDFVVLATGSLPHRLADQPRDPRVHVVNNLDDVLRLRAAFDTATRLLIVGAGLIGGEVASAARRAGLEVDLVDAQPGAFTRALGPVGGTLLTARHRELGVRVHTGRWAEQWRADDTGIHLELDDGTRITADHAVIAVGARPALDWLLGAPETDQPMLQANLEQGLACDSDGRVIGTSALYAVGDSAAWADPGTGVRTRGQHWTLAIEHAEVVAAVITARAGTSEADDEIPFPTVGPAYMWTDQADTKVQVVGDPHLGEDHLTLSAPDDGTVVLTSDRGHVVAVTLVGTPRALAAARAAVVDALPTETALAQIGNRVPLLPSTFDTARR